MKEGYICEKTIIKKFASIVLIIICCLSLSLSVYAASSHTYKSTLAFQGEHTGTTRTYRYQNISYSATVSSYIGKNKVYESSSYPKTYSVSLYRKTGWFSSEKIGSKSLSRYKSGSAKWTNVGKGDYYFYFTKARDGVTVKSSNVVMKSYS